MKMAKKVLAMVLATLMIVSTLAACGGAASSSAPASTPASEPGELDPMRFAGTVLKYACSDTAAVGPENIDLFKLVEEKTGIIIEPMIIPNAAEGEIDTTLVSLQGGSEIDLMYRTTQGLQPFYAAGVLEPLDELAAAVGYDMESVFGSSIPKMADGKAYGLPAFNDVWCVFYNKKIFDDAGVAYPSGDWTWDEYIETAKKLTNPEKNIWGSYMPDYDCVNYMYAIQNGAEHYKADGTSNYDDPKFRESVEWFYSLGNDLKIQPSITDQKGGLHAWNGFVATGVADENGNYDRPRYAMNAIGAWVASMLPNTDKYLRDWEAGIAPLPHPAGQQASTMSVIGAYSIPATSKHKEAAFEALRVIAEDQYTLGYGRIPARIDLTAEEIDAVVEDMVKTYEGIDNITAEMLKDSWFNADMKILPEKVIGAGELTIRQLWSSECQLYGTGGQDLDTCMKNMLEKSNEAISEELANG